MDWRDKGVLVTGGAGFIGSHLTRRLVSEGADVHILIKRDESRSRIQDLLAHFTIWEADLADPASLQYTLSQFHPQVVFHLAALVNSSRSWDLVQGMIQNNIVGTANLLMALKDSGFEVFVHTSSSEEYGFLNVPFTESQRESPVSPYSFSKLSSTIFCQMAAKIFNLPITILRLSPTYGPAQEGSMLIPSAIHDLLTKKEFSMTAGEQLRDFTYVDDIVEAFLRIATLKQGSGEIFNVGTGLPRKVNDVIEIIQKYCDQDGVVNRGVIPYRKGEGMESYCNSEKIKQLTGWSPKVSLEEGLQATVAWYKNFYSNSLHKTK
jgi:nucleoside-diphosphate-sugar epimerase